MYLLKHCDYFNFCFRKKKSSILDKVREIVFLNRLMFMHIEWFAFQDFSKSIFTLEGMLNGEWGGTGIFLLKKLIITIQETAGERKEWLLN